MERVGIGPDSRSYGGDGVRRLCPRRCGSPALRRGRDPSSALPPQDDTSSVIRLAGDRRMPPSPQGEGFGRGTRRHLPRARGRLEGRMPSSRRRCSDTNGRSDQGIAPYAGGRSPSSAPVCALGHLPPLGEGLCESGAPPLGEGLRRALFVCFRLTLQRRSVILNLYEIQARRTRFFGPDV